MLEFIYDGTNFVGVNQGYGTTNYYGAVKLYDNIDSNSYSVAATANAARLAYNRAGDMMNRTVAVTAADTTDYTANVGYTDLKARGEKIITVSSLDSLTSSGLVNGAIAWGYE